MKQASIKAMKAILLLLVLLMSGACAPEAPNTKALTAALRAALAQEDLSAVRNAAAAARRALGEKAGIPEVADKFQAVPKGGRLIRGAL